MKTPSITHTLPAVRLILKRLENVEGVFMSHHESELNRKLIHTFKELEKVLEKLEMES